MVTVLEKSERILARVATPIISSFYETVHRDAGVDLRTSCSVDVFEMSGNRIVGLKLSDGSYIEADCVIVGIGLHPNVELASQAGLEIDDGITVDAYARTNDPCIYAVGDCANHFNPLLGRRIRLESVQNASEQARTAAASICGTNEPYAPVPWFWSDQYELKLQMVGTSEGYEQIALRGDREARAFCTFYLRGGIVIGSDLVNRAADFIAAKSLIAGRYEIPLERLSDSSIPLKSLLLASTNATQREMI
jgi:3-phenylpropionate/trans-cinnamate dioxygenase ferredoxin reductase subunit